MIKSIEEIINILNDKFGDWKDYFYDDKKFDFLNSTLVMDDTKKVILKLMEEIINAQKNIIDSQEENDFWQNLSQIIMDDVVVERMEEMNSGIIEPYKNFQLLRDRPFDIVIQIIMKVFDNLSINYNPEIFNLGEEYGIHNQQEFTNAILQLDRMISIHISRHYDKNTAKKEFIKLSGVNETCGAIYAELYEKNMEKIQHNICLDRIEELDVKIEQLTQEVLKISSMLNDVI